MNPANEESAFSKRVIKNFVSVAVGAIAANIVFVIISFASYLLSFSTSPILSKVSLAVAILLALTAGVPVFRKMHHHLQKED